MRRAASVTEDKANEVKMEIMVILDDRSEKVLGMPQNNLDKFSDEGASNLSSMAKHIKQTINKNRSTPTR